MPEERVLYLSPDKLQFAISPHGNVGVLLDYPRGELGLVPGLSLALELTPAEARNVAQTLLRKADEAEAGSPQA
jgi:hypothetical protein